MGAREDLYALVPATCTHLLDVGCATGEFGALVKQRRPGARVVGLEVDAAMAEVARGRLDDVLVADLSDPASYADRLAGFDCIVCGDVLEHLVDPWSALRSLASVATESAYVVVSLPNVAHLDTLFNLLIRRRWPYRDRGIHDGTHLRFFALENVRALFSHCGLEILTLRRNHRIVERPHRVNRIAPLLAIPGTRELLTFQFLVLGRRTAVSAADGAPWTVPPRLATRP